MRFICAIILIGISFSIHAQRKLTGIITASDTKLPIVSANVYLNNTSIGTVSNNLGEFELTHVPLGPFDLVVSYLGYETFKIEVDVAKLTSQLRIVLIPKVNELQEVIVEAYDKDGWQNWGQLFIENFIGSSSFANDCFLQNKEVLRFRLNKKKNTLKVVADDRIIIENRALGYLLKYDLTAFEFNLTTKEFYFGGYPFFEELETTKKRVEKKYIENRREAYYGSITHFMRSVYRNKIGEQGFEVRKEVLVSWEERQRVKELAKNHPEKISKRSFPMDTKINNAKLFDTINFLNND